MVRKGGVVNFFGGPPSGTIVALDTNRLHYGDITLKATFHLTPATARTAFALITDGRFKAPSSSRARPGPMKFRPVFAAHDDTQRAQHADIKTASLSQRKSAMSEADARWSAERRAPRLIR